MQHKPQNRSRNAYFFIWVLDVVGVFYADTGIAYVVHDTMQHACGVHANVCACLSLIHIPAPNVVFSIWAQCWPSTLTVWQPSW